MRLWHGAQAAVHIVVASTRYGRDFLGLRGFVGSGVVEGVPEQGSRPCWNRWETLRASGGTELIRGTVRPALRELIEAQAAEATGARRYERSVARLNADPHHFPSEAPSHTPCGS